MATPTNYNCISYPRQGTKGGGIAIIYKTSIALQIVEDLTQDEEVCEVISTSFRLPSSDTIKLIAFYRPHDDHLYRFIDVIQEIIERFNTDINPLLIVGDFNFHFDIPTDHNSNVLREVLKSHELNQLVTFPTHRAGRMLDLIITNRPHEDFKLSCNSTIASDHLCAIAQMSLSTKCKQNVKHEYASNRSWKSVDPLQVGIQFKHSFEIKCTYNGTADTNHVADTLMECMLEVADALAPITTRRVHPNRRCPYFNAQTRTLKRIRRQLERRYVRSRSLCDLTAYRSACRKERQALERLRKSYYRNEVKQIGNDSKRLASFFDKFTGRAKTDPVANLVRSKPGSVDELNRYFITKVENIVNGLQQTPSTPASPLQVHMTDDQNHWDSFQMLNENDVLKIVKSSSTKHCELDPIPTKILKSSLMCFTPALTTLLNSSLSSGVFPDVFKLALVKPKLKKANLDASNYKNIRPISNLTYAGKLIEKAVLQQYTAHLDSHSLSGAYQSAYKKHHSTETLLMSIFDDIYRALDSGRIVLLVLLDYSAAFDLVDHERLLTTLKQNYLVSGKPLQWFASYLSNRSQSVLVNNTRSIELELNRGVPQGSLLGGALFAAYVEPIKEVIQSHALSFHAYADDHQLFTFASFDDIASQARKVESCIEEITQWSTTNLLKLNPEKTEFLIITKPTIRFDIPISFITVLGSQIQVSTEVRDLGVIIDHHMSLDAQVTEICRKANFALQRVKQMSEYLDRGTLSNLIAWYVLPQIDYCNGILCGIPIYQLNRIQKVLNHAIRTIYRLPYRTPTTKYFKELGWLKVKDRINFKILTTMYKCLHGLAPSYLSERMIPTTHCDGLRLRRTFQVPRTKSKFGDRAITTVAPKLFNALPDSIKASSNLSSFKRNLRHFYLDLYH